MLVNDLLLAGSRWRRPLAVLVAVLAAGTSVQLSTAPAHAAIYSIMPGDGAAPNDSFTDQDQLFAYGSGDMRGGEVCIVAEGTNPAPGSSFDCSKSYAWGSPNELLGVGTIIAPIEAAPLRVGSWRLVAEYKDRVSSVSDVFTVSPCPDCDPYAGLEAALPWKMAAAQALPGGTALCLGATATTLMYDVTGLYKTFFQSKPPTTDVGRYDYFQDVKKAIKRAKTIVGLGSNLHNQFQELIKVTDSWNDPATHVQDMKLGKIADMAWWGLEYHKWSIKFVGNIACRAAATYADIAADPPRPDFGETATPQTELPDGAPNDTFGAAAVALDGTAANGEAARISYERFQGARDAGDVAAQIRQLDLTGQFTDAQVAQTRLAIDRLRALADEAEQHGIWGDSTADDLEAVRLFQERIATEGFSADERAYLIGTVGATEAEIADIETEIAPLAGSFPSAQDRLADLIAEADRWRADGMPGSVREALLGNGFSEPAIAMIERNMRMTQGSGYDMADSKTQQIRDLASAMETNLQAFVDFGTATATTAARLRLTDVTLPIATPMPPVVSAISACGQWGAVTPATTEGVTYTVEPAAVREGAYRVTASPAPGYALSPDAVREWSGDLGRHTDCRVVTPQAPTVIAISQCGTWGSVTPATTDGVSYTVEPASPREGPYRVRAVVAEGYVLADGAQTEWAGDLGRHRDCITVTPAVPTDVPIAACGTYGSVALPSTAGIVYSISPASPRSGRYTATATAADGYVLAPGAPSSWQGDLGVYRPCATAAENAYGGVSGAFAFDPLANDALQGVAATMEIIERPAHGSLECTPLGGCLYTPDAGYVGPDSFRYRLVGAGIPDGDGQRAIVRLTIVGRPPAPLGAPRALDDRLVLAGGAPGTIDVLANDTGDGTLRVQAAGPARNGSASCAADGACSYTPHAGFTGFDVFTYTVTNGKDVSTGTVAVAVGAVVPAPVVSTTAGAALQPGELASWGVSLPQAGVSTAFGDLASGPITARVGGAHDLVPGSVRTAPGWTASGSDAVGGRFAGLLGADALAPAEITAVPGPEALIGSTLTATLPRPMPPISQGVGGDGHVPILVGDKVFAFYHHASPTAVSCVDRATGQRCPGYPQAVPVRTGNNNGPGAVIGEQIWVHATASTSSQGLFCWDAATDAACGMIVFEHGDGAWAGSAPVVAGGRLWMATSDGRLLCGDPATRLPCSGAPVIPTGVTSSADLLDIVARGDRVYVSNFSQAACLDTAANAPCADWPQPRSLQGNLVVMHDGAGVAIGVCGAAGDVSCRTDAAPGSLERIGTGWPYDPSYSSSVEAEAGARTFYGHISYTGVGCWDWGTRAPCAGPNFSGGWVTRAVGGSTLPRAPYGAVWDGSAAVVLGDPGDLYTVDYDGNSPATALRSDVGARTVDLRQQRCDGTVGAARWGSVQVVNANLAPGAELTSFVVSVKDAESGALVASQSMLGTDGRLDLSGVDSAAHPSIVMEANAASTQNGAAWSDGRAPLLELSWSPDPLALCFDTRTAATCPAVDAPEGSGAFALAVEASTSGGSSRRESAVEFGDSCLAPTPTTPSTTPPVTSPPGTPPPPTGEPTPGATAVPPTASMSASPATGTTSASAPTPPAPPAAAPAGQGLAETGLDALALMAVVLGGILLASAGAILRRGEQSST